MEPLATIGQSINKSNNAFVLSVNEVNQPVSHSFVDTLYVVSDEYDKLQMR